MKSSTSSKAASPQTPQTPQEKQDVVENIVKGLTNVYLSRIKPVEDAYEFSHFQSPPLSEADIQSKPIVLLLGQYSVGKSTFIKHLLGKEYPGCNIGPEPTTDRFYSIMSSPNGEDRIIPGNAAAVSSDLPYTSLTRLGTAFLEKFQVCQMSSSILDSITLIDTPGVLSGEKQRINRQYEFTDVIKWFAERADIILLIFDAHKLDISDEFKGAINATKGNENKIRVVLNKADSINGQQLTRVYGALMWSLGRVFSHPEVPRVYLGSFWDQPLQHRDLETLLVSEKRDLLADLRDLPRNSIIRRINEVIRRARMAKTHALIIGHFKKEMPGFFGKTKQQNALLDNIEEEFAKVQMKNQLPKGDFPDPVHFREHLAQFKIDKLQKYDKKLMEKLDDALTETLPNLLSEFPQTAPISLLEDNSNPFDDVERAPPAEKLWSFTFIDRTAYLEKFASLGPVAGKLNGQSCKPAFEEFGHDKAFLSKTWMLSDWTKDGYLDSDEFVVAMWLCEMKKRNWITELPDVLPITMVPNYKRG